MNALGWSRYAASSLVMHGFLLILLRGNPTATAPAPATTTEFLPIDVPEPKPKEPPPELPDPAEEPTPELTQKRPKPPLRRQSAANPEPESNDSPPPPALPVRLAGLGLSNADLVFSATDAASRSGSGSSTKSAATGEARPAAPKVPEGSPVVRLADLSVRPSPPALEGRLRANYPRDLERQGIEGDALVRLTLSTSGKVERTQTLSRSHAAFAEACKRTVSGSVWSPPRDRAGRAVRTTVDYRCRFRVR
jgi:TonB family protein